MKMCEERAFMWQSAPIFQVNTWRLMMCWCEMSPLHWSFCTARKCNC